LDAGQRGSSETTGLQNDRQNDQPSVSLGEQEGRELYGADEIGREKISAQKQNGDVALGQLASDLLLP